MDGAGVVALVVFILIIVAAIAYRVGYLWAQVEFLSHRQMIEAKWSILPMEAPLSRWRRVTGWAAYAFSGFMLCFFLALAYWHAHSWGWAYLLTAWGLWFAIFLAGLWLAEWCWRPSREAPAPAPMKADSA